MLTQFQQENPLAKTTIYHTEKEAQWALELPHTECDVFQAMRNVVNLQVQASTLCAQLGCICPHHISDKLAIAGLQVGVVAYNIRCQSFQQCLSVEPACQAACLMIK